MLAAITAALQALAAWLIQQIKLAPIKYDEKANKTEDEIYNLSRSPDPLDQSRVLLLVARVKRLREYTRQLANLPTANPLAKSGSPDPDDAGDIHPAN